MKRGFKILALGIVAVCLFIAGISIGYHRAYDKVDKLYLETFYSVSASEIKCKVNLLELLSDGKYIAAQDKLEGYLDLELANLAVYVSNPPLKQDKDIVGSIGIAKKYREKHSEHRVRPSIENSVRKTLDFVSSDPPEG